MTNTEQKNLFDTFGFVVLRQVFARDEIKAIDDAFEETINKGMQEAGIDRQRLDRKFVIDPGFCEQNPVLRTLIDDERITRTIANLFEPGWFYASSDGHLYLGDTLWHSDTGWGPGASLDRDDPSRDQSPARYYPAMKIALYLDPVEKETGCLRTIPGSHLSPLHESLASLHCDIPETAPHLLSDPNFKKFNVPPSEIPSYPIESKPGDVLFFSSMCWHAAFGGTLRRMFSLWYQSKGENQRQREYGKQMKERTRKIAEQYS